MDLILQNLLPYDGTAIYYGPILSPERAADFYEKLFSQIAWRNDEVVLFGKRHVTRRKSAWYGDGTYDYTYSNATKTALPWIAALAELKILAEKHSGERYNSCLLNLYHDGNEGMGWHSDDEKTIVKDSAIASMSFGAERRFSFKHKTTKECVSVTLENGSLLVMKDKTQTHWLHSLPKATKIDSPRINLTFRQFK